MSAEVVNLALFIKYTESFSFLVLSESIFKPASSVLELKIIAFLVSMLNFNESGLISS